MQIKAQMEKRRPGIICLVILVLMLKNGDGHENKMQQLEYNKFTNSTESINQSQREMHTRQKTKIIENIARKQNITYNSKITGKHTRKKQTEKTNTTLQENNIVSSTNKSQTRQKIVRKATPPKGNPCRKQQSICNKTKTQLSAQITGFDINTSPKSTHVSIAAHKEECHINNGEKTSDEASNGGSMEMTLTDEYTSKTPVEAAVMSTTGQRSLEPTPDESTHVSISATNKTPLHLSTNSVTSDGATDGGTISTTLDGGYTSEIPVQTAAMSTTGQTAVEPTSNESTYVSVGATHKTRQHQSTNAPTSDGASHGVTISTTMAGSYTSKSPVETAAISTTDETSVAPASDETSYVSVGATHTTPEHESTNVVTSVGTTGGATISTTEAGEYTSAIPVHTAAMSTIDQTSVAPTSDESTYVSVGATHTLPQYQSTNGLTSDGVTDGGTISSTLAGGYTSETPVETASVRTTDETSVAPSSDESTYVSVGATHTTPQHHSTNAVSSDGATAGGKISTTEAGGYTSNTLVQTAAMSTTDQRSVEPTLDESTYISVSATHTALQHQSTNEVTSDGATDGGTISSTEGGVVASETPIQTATVSTTGQTAVAPTSDESTYVSVGLTHTTPQRQSTNSVTSDWFTHGVTISTTEAGGLTSKTSVETAEMSTADQTAVAPTSNESTYVSVGATHTTLQHQSTHGVTSDVVTDGSAISTTLDGGGTPGNYSTVLSEAATHASTCNLSTYAVTSNGATDDGANAVTPTGATNSSFGMAEYLVFDVCFPEEISNSLC